MQKNQQQLMQSSKTEINRVNPGKGLKLSTHSLKPGAYAMNYWDRSIYSDIECILCDKHKVYQNKAD